MSMLEKLKKGFNKKAEVNHTTAEKVYEEKLQKILYDADLVKEFAPIFAKLSQHDGFEKVFELLESKESQLEALAGGEWTKQEETGNNEQEEEEKEVKTLTADQILEAKYSNKEK